MELPEELLEAEEFAEPPAPPCPPVALFVFVLEELPELLIVEFPAFFKTDTPPVAVEEPPVAVLAEFPPLEVLDEFALEFVVAVELLLELLD